MQPFPEEGFYAAKYPPDFLLTPLLEAALRYAEHGWPVFPCQPRGKRPLTRNGFKDAATHVVTIEGWWRQWPEANIGVPTGVGTWDALDVDGPVGSESVAKLEAELGELPYGPLARTGGGGAHHCFLGGSLTTTTHKLPGIDMRSAGGYVIVPPSIHESGAAYEWIVSPFDDVPFPEPGPYGALATQLVKYVPINTGQIVHVSDTQIKALLGMAGIELRELKQGERNDKIFRVGCSLAGKGASGEAIAKILTAVNSYLCFPPLPEREFNNTLQSATKFSTNPEYQLIAEVGRRADIKATELAEQAQRKIATTEEKTKRVIEKLDKQSAKASQQAEKMAAEEAVKVAISSGDKNLIREMLEKETGVRIERVLQTGSDTHSYHFELPGGRRIHVGGSLLSQRDIAENVIALLQNPGFAEISAKRWPSVRRALVSLIEISSLSEMGRETETFGWLSQYRQDVQNGPESLRKGFERILNREPFDESGAFYVSAGAVAANLQAHGIRIAERDVAGRLHETGAAPIRVTIRDTDGDRGRAQARYWKIPLILLQKAAEEGESEEW